MATPFGALGIRCNERAVTGIDFLPAETRPLAPVNSIAAQACAELQSYLDDPAHRFHVPLELHGTPYQRKVWQAIAGIPAAQPLSYGELASRIGASPRAVGQACGANPIPIVIPCHRVIRSDGSLGNYGDDPALKALLLAHEREHGAGRKGGA